MGLRPFRLSQGGAEKTAQLYRPTLRLNHLLRNFGRRAVFGAEPGSDCFLAEAATNVAHPHFSLPPQQPGTKSVFGPSLA